MLASSFVFFLPRLVCKQIRMLVSLNTDRSRDGAFSGLIILLDELPFGLIPKAFVSSENNEVDRLATIEITARFFNQAQLPTIMFGNGFNSHKFELIAIRKELYEELNLEMEQPLPAIVRTNSMAGLAIDYGLLGLPLIIVAGFLSIFRRTSEHLNRSVYSYARH